MQSALLFRPQRVLGGEWHSYFPQPLAGLQQEPSWGCPLPSGQPGTTAARRSPFFMCILPARSLHISLLTWELQLRRVAAWGAGLGWGQEQQWTDPPPSYVCSLSVTHLRRGGGRTHCTTQWKVQCHCNCLSPLSLPSLPSPTHPAKVCPW